MEQCCCQPAAMALIILSRQLGSRLLLCRQALCNYAVSCSISQQQRTYSFEAECISEDMKQQQADHPAGARCPGLCEPVLLSLREASSFMTPTLSQLKRMCDTTAGFPVLRQLVQGATQPAAETLCSQVHLCYGERSRLRSTFCTSKAVGNRQPCLPCQTLLSEHGRNIKRRAQRQQDMLTTQYEQVSRLQPLTLGRSNQHPALTHIEAALRIEQTAAEKRVLQNRLQARKLNPNLYALSSYLMSM